MFPVLLTSSNGEDDSNSRDSGISMTDPDELSVAEASDDTLLAVTGEDKNLDESEDQESQRHQLPACDVACADEEQFEVLETPAKEPTKKKRNKRVPLTSLLGQNSHNVERDSFGSSPVTSRRGSLIVRRKLFLSPESPAGDSAKMATMEDRSLIARTSSATTSEDLLLKSRKRSLVPLHFVQKKAKSSPEAAIHVEDLNVESKVETHDRFVAISRTVSCSVLEVSSHTDKTSEVGEVYALPEVDNPQKVSNGYRSISPLTLATEMRRLGPEEFSKLYIVIDCRYPFEFEGGHVQTAINLYDQGKLEEVFYPKSSRIPIFYCEFSQKRGPGMALALRSIDRKRNFDTYPYVDYEEVYLLDRGYKKLWEDGSFKDICEPASYVPMNHKSHRASLLSFKWHKSRSTQSSSRLAINGFAKRDTLLPRSLVKSFVKETEGNDVADTSPSSSLVILDDAGDASSDGLLCLDQFSD